jgi:flagellum-specific peptidoglycan hydrolase FlgJ
MTPVELEFLHQAAVAADTAGHIFPQMAACEAGEESRYGQSLLAIQDSNLFGMKQHRHAAYGTATLPTREFENGEWVEVDAEFVKYASWAQCFQDRMVTLCRLAGTYKNYADALHATDANDYIFHVSKTWSTDTHRAETISLIYREAFGEKELVTV